MRRSPSIVSSLGLVLILVGALRDGDGASGAVAFLALLILGALTYPPAEAFRGVQAVMIMASTAGLLVLMLLFEGLWGGRAELGDLPLALIGTALVVVDAAGRRWPVPRSRKTPSAGTGAGIGHGRSLRGPPGDRRPRPTPAARCPAGERDGGHL